MKSTKPFMEQCYLCKSEFQMGGGEFSGYFVKYYGITVCRGCFRASKDGWPTATDRRCKRTKGVLPITSSMVG